MAGTPLGPNTTLALMCARRRAKLITQENIDRMQIPGARYVFRELAIFRSDLSEEDQQRLDPARSGFRSDFFTIGYVRQGRVNARIDHKDMGLVAGDIAFASPHRIKRMVGDNPACEVHVILFTLEFLKRVKLRRLSDLLTLFSTTDLPVLHLLPEQQQVMDRTIERLEQRIDAMHSHSFGMELVVNGFVDLLLELGHIGRDEHTVPYFRMGRKEELVTRFAKLMQEHYLTERHLAFYSEQLFVTTKHLSETVKEITGRTAGQLIDDQVLVESRRLLEDTGLSISEVAYQLQFTSPAQFSKFFQRTAGTSPRAYRQRVDQQPVEGRR